MGIFKDSNANKLLLANTGGGYGDAGSVVMQTIVDTSGTFTVTAAMQEITFIGVGGGGAGDSGYAGGGAGFFQKTFQIGQDIAPGTALTLQIAAATGTTYLRDAGGTFICQATGGTNATTSAHGIGGTASGGDINSKSAPGNTEGGGAAGSPFGDSVGSSMYLIQEYATAYVQKVKAACIANGYMFSAAKPGDPFVPTNLHNGATTHGGFGVPGWNSPPLTNSSSGGNGGFGAPGGSGNIIHSDNGSASSGGTGGFGASGGIGGATQITTRAGSGGKGGVFGGSGSGGKNTSSNSNSAYRGGNGGAGGYGGGGARAVRVEAAKITALVVLAVPELSSSLSKPAMPCASAMCRRQP